ncbi:MAG: glutamine amidotransferase [Verrucomicrobiia bacterium]|tara:strand:- start:1801 stop:4164 length:2364 start_codon:yes stop_codon:yes gene_type:complete
MPFAVLNFAGSSWWWVAVLAATGLIPLAWYALRPAEQNRGSLAVGLSLRLLGIGLLLLCLLDPQWLAPRAKPGANILAVLTDNSQGMAIVDRPGDPTRGERLRTDLIAPSTAWLEDLNSQFQVRPYLFDDELRRVGDFAALDFSGPRSDLGHALDRIRERFATQPLAGVLLFTDGNATDLTSTLTDASGLPPIFPVVVGETAALRDLRITQTTLRQTAFDDAPVSLRVGLAGRSVTDEPLSVTVRPLNASGAEAPIVQSAQLFRDNQPEDVDFDWRPTGSGIQFYEATALPTSSAAPAEATTANNRRYVMVDRGRPTYRILYVGGRPNWEFKYLNRALLEDPQIDLVGLLRLARREPKFEFRGRAGESSNPLYRGFTDATDDTARYDEPVLTRINTRDAEELRTGFPRTIAELFAYDAVILDDVEAEFFSPDQQMLLRRFTGERGGGLLLLGGVDSLANGDYQSTPLSAALPIYLDRRAERQPTGQLTWDLTREGWLESWTRVRAVEADERDRLTAMPPFLIANSVSATKPGATVLSSLTDDVGQTFPGLVAQRFGSGRVAVLTVGDLWRWGLAGETEQLDLARFWRQISRWLVTEVPTPVNVRVAQAEQGAARQLTITARDEDYHPLDLAKVQVTITRADWNPDADNSDQFTSVSFAAEPSVDAPGRYLAEFTGREPGGYLAQVEVSDSEGRLIGTAEAGWVNDPIAEEFASLDPNVALLAEIARQTGGRVLTFADLDGLAAELVRAPAPITETHASSLWHNSAVFGLVLLCFVAEWVWRRWKGLA